MAEQVIGSNRITTYSSSSSDELENNSSSNRQTPADPQLQISHQPLPSGDESVPHPEATVQLSLKQGLLNKNKGKSELAGSFDSTSEYFSSSTEESYQASCVPVQEQTRDSELPNKDRVKMGLSKRPPVVAFSGQGHSLLSTTPAEPISTQSISTRLENSNKTKAPEKKIWTVKQLVMDEKAVKTPLQEAEERFKNIQLQLEKPELKEGSAQERNLLSRSAKTRKEIKALKQQNQN